MQKSDSIKNIGEALQLFHQKMEPLKRDADNPFFKSKYVTLSNVLQNIITPLAECGLIYTQFPDGDSLTTVLIHAKTGEYMEAAYNIHAAKNDPQAVASAITYARRYALSAILGLSIDEDDDGNIASGKTESPAQPKQQVPTKSWLNKFEKDGTTITEKWKKAEETLLAGKATVAKILEKYIVSKILQEELRKLEVK